VQPDVKLERKTYRSRTCPYRKLHPEIAAVSIRQRHPRVDLGVFLNFGKERVKAGIAVHGFAKSFIQQVYDVLARHSG
jgi:hypothetical protein